MGEQLDIGDFLLIAEAVTGIDAKSLARVTRLPSAESALAAPFASFGGEDFYTDPVERAAICCSRIVRNHPLIDGNKRVGYECMIEMLHRGGVEWVQPDDVPGGDAPIIEALASGQLTESEFIDWLHWRVS